MMKLIEIMPTKQEEQLTAGMPEQVAIGYIRARRKANGARGIDLGNRGGTVPPFAGLGDLFGGMFGNG